MQMIACPRGGGEAKKISILLERKLVRKRSLMLMIVKIIELKKDKIGLRMTKLYMNIIQEIKFVLL